MTKKQLLKDLVNNVYCRLKPSAIAGVGVFAVRTIPKGTNPFESSKNPRVIGLNNREVARLPSPVRKMVKDFCSFKDGRYLMPHFGLNGIDIAHYLNSSANPNVIPKIIKKNGDVEFITNRIIRTGEELTTDYKSFSDF